MVWKRNKLILKKQNKLEQAPSDSCWLRSSQPPQNTTLTFLLMWDESHSRVLQESEGGSRCNDLLMGHSPAQVHLPAHIMAGGVCDSRDYLHG